MSNHYQPIYLTRQLEILGRYTARKIPNLNAGGCCVYAAHVANRISDLNIPTWGVASSGFGHVMVRFKHENRTYTHDTSRTIYGRVVNEFLLQEPLMKKIFLPHQLMDMADDTSQWSAAFNRRKYMGEIIDCVDKFLSDEALYAH